MTCAQLLTKKRISVSRKIVLFKVEILNSLSSTPIFKVIFAYAIELSSNYFFGNYSNS